MDGEPRCQRGVGVRPDWSLLPHHRTGWVACRRQARGAGSVDPVTTVTLRPGLAPAVVRLTRTTASAYSSFCWRKSTREISPSDHCTVSWPASSRSRSIRERRASLPRCSPYSRTIWTTAPPPSAWRRGGKGLLPPGNTQCRVGGTIRAAVAPPSGRRPYGFTIADVAVDGTFPAAEHEKRVDTWVRAILEAWAGSADSRAPE